MNAARLRECIVAAAQECESCMRLADFAEHESGLAGATGLGAGLRKLAAYHSGNAFEYATRLTSTQQVAA